MARPIADTSVLRVLLISSDDHYTPATGVTAPTVYYVKPGGAATQLVAPGWAEVDAVHMPGIYNLTPSAGMVDTAGQVAFDVAKAGCETFHGLFEDEAAVAVDMDVVRKVLTNKSVESEDGETITVYEDDDSTVFGTFAYNPATKTLGKFTPA